MDGIPLTSVLELLAYCGLEETSKEIHDWRVPRFPVNGWDLKQKGLEGRELGLLLKALRQRWKDSYFTLTKEELLGPALEDSRLLPGSTS